MADTTHTNDIDRGTCELCNSNPCLCVVSIRDKIYDNKDHEKDSGILNKIDLERVRRGSQ